MKRAWERILPSSYLRDWTTTYADEILGPDLGMKKTYPDVCAWHKPVLEAEKVFSDLAEIEWDGEFIRRDTIDIARTALDRIISLRYAELDRDVAKWRGSSAVESGGVTGLVARSENLAALSDAMADLLELHTDYSLWESYLRLDAIEKIRNPDFPQTLFENASCYYCRSHQYELARYWYAAHMRETAKNLARAVKSGDRKARFSPDPAIERLALKAKALKSLRPSMPRTKESYRKVMKRIVELLSK
jgi:hypothetical protein